MRVKFTYDPVSKQARSSDPDIFLERGNISREMIYTFRLHWHGRRIAVNATWHVTGVPPSTHHDWTIVGLGRINLHVPPYYFGSRTEINDAARLALDAMSVMPLSLLPNETPVITARLSPDVELLLEEFPVTVRNRPRKGLH